ncbi:hypothetical protein HGA13_08750 [Nocardia speluncae]|uniref:Uncharacterized protein n=1 Tax=Nocardia speluncae TaxID=419477 RepID=A0A846XCN0_9NOCA|nr:hypothetical protein [Nocardia speluncae]NKY33155.1 hypothetical protein [Nocardia speluncae]
MPATGTADLDTTLEALLPMRVEQGCDLVAIKPACFIDDPDEMAGFCRAVVDRIDAMF